MLTHLGRHAEALESLQQAARLESGEPAIGNNVGEVLVRLGQHEEAVRAFDRALALDTSYAPAWFGKARALLHLKRFDSAADACRRFLTLAGPEDPLVPTARQWLELCSHGPGPREESGGDSRPS
jgi:tetratricopeptide (TPR) repeat protein